jgi:sulfopyruvate decarboxylase subunit alpha
VPADRGRPGDGRDERVAREIFEGLRAGGVRFASYLPDSRLFRLLALIRTERSVTSVRCVREDEGVAIAVGAAMGGAGAVAIMEGTGLGYCGLVLARAQLQRTPLLLLFSHAAGLGESLPHHATAIAASRAILRGLDIPCTVLDSERRIQDTVSQALVTVRGQRCVYALALPGFVHAD